MLNVQQRPVPALWRRLFAVWWRHYTVYNRNFFTNSFGIVLEPVIFFAAMAWGLAASIGEVGGMDYLLYLAPAQIMIGVAFSSVFECSYGTYFRLAMDRNYDSMIMTPVSVSEVFWGELFYAGTRAAFFGGLILAVFWAWGLIPSPWALLTPFVAFFAGITMATLGLFANRLVRSINQFNFFITGLVTPLILFSGTLFPIDRLPAGVALVAQWTPFYPYVHVARMLTTGEFQPDLGVGLAYLILAPWVLGYFAVRCMKPKLIS